MVYNQKFVAVVKVNGKILRETNKENEVILPFGSEYSLQFKNLDDRRAVVEVSIDGTDVMDGRRLVIEPNDDGELKGVMINNAVKNAFKFIQKTKKIQDHRGDKIDDGFIRIKFGFERIIDSTITWTYPTVYRSSNVRSFYSDSSETYGSRRIISKGIVGNPMAKSNISSSVAPNFLGECELPQEEEGITVAGSELNQNFGNTNVGTIEDKGTIIIRLKGTNEIEVPVKTPLYVSTRFECPTCGTKSKHKAKFCQECGTNIEIKMR